MGGQGGEGNGAAYTHTRAYFKRTLASGRALFHRSLHLNDKREQIHLEMDVGPRNRNVTWHARKLQRLQVTANSISAVLSANTCTV